MSRLTIARPEKRKALYVTVGKGTKEEPNLIFPLENVEKGELDELIRAILAKLGIVEESVIQKVIEEAEQRYETRILVSEAKAKLRKYMQMKAEGKSLMQNGFRKWVEVWYPAVKAFKKTE